MTHSIEDISRDLDAAEQVVDDSRLWREEVRWRVKRTDPIRQARLAQLLDAIEDVMRPLKSHIGRAVHEPLPESLDRRLREASAAIQYERKQLKKMR